jgi:heme-degrading monooxygenase HmoA
MMLARVWHSITLTSKADQYMNCLNQVVLPDYRAANGNRGVYVFRWTKGELSHFLLLSLWATRQELIAFAGPEPEQVRQYPCEKQCLLAFESMAKHYEVLAEME